MLLKNAGGQFLGLEMCEMFGRLWAILATYSTTECISLIAVACHAQVRFIDIIHDEFKVCVLPSEIGVCFIFISMLPFPQQAFRILFLHSPPS